MRDGSSEGEERPVAGRWGLLDSAAFERKRERARLAGDPELRAIAQDWTMARAALVLSGEIGYSEVTVERLVERSGSNRDRFYRTFRDKAQCFETGYRAAIEELCDRLLDACDPSLPWPVAARAGLDELDRFLASEPALARGLLAEVFVAGNSVAAKRQEVIERLARAVDDGGREGGRSRHSPPPITGEFVVSGIEAAMLKSFRSGSAFAEMVPELVYMAVLFYLGSETAWAEMRRLS